MYQLHRSTQPHADETTSEAAPGRKTLTGTLQRKGPGGSSGNSQEIAASGFAGGTMNLPYRAEMEQGFGVSFAGVQAYGGGAAASAATRPKKSRLLPLIRFYMHVLIPFAGGTLSGFREAYRYLPDSTEHFITAEERGCAHGGGRLQEI